MQRELPRVTCVDRLKHKPRLAASDNRRTSHLPLYSSLPRMPRGSLAKRCTSQAAFANSNRQLFVVRAWGGLPLRQLRDRPATLGDDRLGSALQVDPLSAEVDAQ